MSLLADSSGTAFRCSECLARGLSSLGQLPSLPCSYLRLLSRLSFDHLKSTVTNRMVQEATAHVVPLLPAIVTGIASVTSIVLLICQRAADNRHLRLLKGGGTLIPYP